MKKNWGNIYDRHGEGLTLPLCSVIVFGLSPIELQIVIISQHKITLFCKCLFHGIKQMHQLWGGDIA